MHASDNPNVTNYYIVILNRIFVYAIYEAAQLMYATYMIPVQCLISYS